MALSVEAVTDALRMDMMGRGWSATSVRVKAADGDAVALVGLLQVDVQSNLIRPTYSAIVHVPEKLGEDLLEEATLFVIDCLRKFSVVQGARRLDPARSYERMEVVFGGVSV